jgi:parvulin-like peptidyl-prolyl isomerase
MKALFFLLAAALLLARPSSAQVLTNVNGIAAIVDDAIITRQEVFEYMGPSARLLIQTVRRQDELDQKLSKMHESATEYLVNRQLILHEFKTAGYNYPESIIEDRIQERIKLRYRDHATLIQELHAQKTTYESFRKQQREEILVLAMRSLKAPQDTLISPQKIRDFYNLRQTNFAVGDAVKLRLIVLNKPPTDKGERRQLAEEILRKINEGASFAEMARIHSDSPTKKDGGDSGWAERDTIQKALSDVAFGLKAGEHSGVVDLPDACWLVRVEERRPAQTRPLSEVRDVIERELRIEEAERQEQKWIKRLKEKSFVRYY